MGIGKLEGEYWVVVCGVGTFTASFDAIFDATYLSPFHLILSLPPTFDVAWWAHFSEDILTLVSLHAWTEIGVAVRYSLFFSRLTTPCVNDEPVRSN